MFCTKCGSQISEGQAFCGNCGTPAGGNGVNENMSSQLPPSHGKMSMHCPRCGNTRLQVQANNRITSSTSIGRSIGKRHAIGSTAYNSVTETFWFCPSCGMKFRDLDELKQIIFQRKESADASRKLIIIFAIMYLSLGVFARIIGDTGFITLKVVIAIYIFVPLIPMGIFWLWATNDAKNREEEYNNLLPKVRRMD